MYAQDTLDYIASKLLDSSKVQKYFSAYLEDQWQRVWTLRDCTSALEIRDYTEQVASELLKEFHIQYDLDFSNLLRLIRQTPDVSRSQVTGAFLKQSLEKVQGLILEPYAPKYVEFCTKKELELFYKTCEQIGLYHPVLAAPRETIEKIIGKMQGAIPRPLALADMHSMIKELEVTTCWPVLALWQSVIDGTAEQLFLNAPLPRIFGFPSSMRNDLRFSSDVLYNEVSSLKASIHMENLVITGHGQLCYYEAKQYTVVAASRAFLCASLPGLIGHVWCLNPKTNEAAIYCVKPTFKTVAHFELPKEASDATWIDCQRNLEGHLVLLWGQINSFTGSMYTQNMSVLDEDALLEGHVTFLDSEQGIPNRQTKGLRLDWRDHGNLLSVQHTVKDSFTTKRVWTHTYDIVFSNYCIASIQTDSRPIEAVYGTPKDFLLLCPLSKTQVQHWSSQDKKFTMIGAHSVPKGPWQSLVLVF